MNTTYPSQLSDAEWECLQQHLPVGQHMADRQIIACERCVMPSFLSYELAAPGATYLPTFRLGKPYIPIFAACA